MDEIKKEETKVEAELPKKDAKKEMLIKTVAVLEGMTQKLEDTVEKGLEKRKDSKIAGLVGPVLMAIVVAILLIAFNYPQVLGSAIFFGLIVGFAPKIINMFIKKNEDKK
jgi:hypothetical protein